MTKYATLENDMGGLDYRTIAHIMTCNGELLGHSTVRNVILRVMERFACAIMAQYGAWGDPAEIAKNPDFQMCIAALIQEVVLRPGQNKGQPHSYYHGN